MRRARCGALLRACESASSTLTGVETAGACGAASPHAGWSHVTRNALRDSGRCASTLSRWGSSTRPFGLRFDRERLGTRIHANGFQTSAVRRMVGPFMGDPLMWLMGANVAVFGCWHVLHPSFMRKHFLLSEQNIKAKRYHTVITSAFSHNDLSHLGANMFALFFMGRFLASYSPQVLLMTYFACGVGGSLVFLVHQRMQRRGLWEMYTRPYGSSALGASGAVNGISTAVAVLAPMSQILLFPLPVPMPLFVATALIMSRDLWGMYDGKGSNVAHSAHIGGAAVGAALGLLLRARVL